MHGLNLFHLLRVFLHRTCKVVQAVLMMTLLEMNTGIILINNTIYIFFTGSNLPSPHKSVNDIKPANNLSLNSVFK